MSCKRVGRLAWRKIGRARADQDVCDILKSTIGLVTIEQRGDLSGHQATGSAGAAHVRADKTERDVVGRQIDHLAHLSDVADVRSPVLDVVDVDQADIEIDVHVAAGPAWIESGESFTRQLLG